MSTPANAITTIIGGLGNDTVNVTGEITETIYSAELEGNSGTINHGVESTLDDDYDGLFVEGINLIVANGKAWGGVVKNYTSMGPRRLDKDFGVSYDADINKAIEAITSAAAANPRVHADPVPWAKVVNLGDSSVDIQLRAWCDAADYKALSTEISQPVKEALDAAGIGIPYPHEVKIKQHVKSSKGRDSLAKFKALKQKNA